MPPPLGGSSTVAHGTTARVSKQKCDTKVALSETPGGGGGGGWWWLVVVVVLTVCLDDVSVHATKRQAPNHGGRVPVDTTPGPAPVCRALKTHPISSSTR